MVAEGGALVSKKSADQYRIDNFTSIKMYHFINIAKENFHLIYWVSPTGSDFKKKLRDFPEFLYSCTVLYFPELPREAYEALGSYFLEQAPIDPSLKTLLINAGEHLYNEAKLGTVKFYSETHQIVYMMPSLYIDLYRTFTVRLRSL